MAQLVAIYRNPSYSPLQHRVNDTAILDATVAQLEADGWRAIKTTELEIERGRLPAANLYLNMCQGTHAAEVLMPLETDGVVIVNRPSSALNCHRRRLVELLRASGLPFPHTVLQPTDGPPPSSDDLAALRSDGGKVWVKRGDVHAERPEDVVATTRERVSEALDAFHERGIQWVALQEHIPGPVVKFYGVADGRFFNWYGADAGVAGERPAVDAERLKALAADAAAAIGLEVFGGDVAFPEPDRPVLIDINDWPSFAPFREDAARAIAAYLSQRFAIGDVRDAYVA